MAIQDAIVREFSARARKVLGAELVSIYWFGSRARGEGTVDSDYDFLIETTHRLTETERDSIADIAVDISADHGVLLDIHSRTVEAMHRKRPFSLFSHTVRQEGVAV